MSMTRPEAVSVFLLCARRSSTIMQAILQASSSQSHHTTSLRGPSVTFLT